MSLSHLKTSPFAVPFYDADDEMLQHWFIFCVCVAGKSAAQQEKKVDAFLGELRATVLPRNTDMLPFARLARMSRTDIEALLRRVKMGRYETITSALTLAVFETLANPCWLRECTVDHLMCLPGIGPKTARFFLMYTRRGFRGAVLDTHILKWLDEQQGTPPICEFPKSTPQNPKRYAEIEDIFLAVCDATSQTPADFDFQIWKSMARPQHV
jgi:thermostable 8-oxoguanine DNA glycosylase